MSEEAYSVIAMLTALAYAVVLFLRWRQGRILKRIINSLTDEQRRQVGLPPKSADSGDG
ncbi:MAG TPA: hypothetical protein VM733_17760 [Thermoanaerobaculia bacterium]|nr:hypothetical protein [Thermoanaerobaculia bacterium]